MNPERLWWALGSGQRLNEDITGLPWPEKVERNALLGECADIVRALFRGESVTHRGRVTLVDGKQAVLAAQATAAASGGRGERGDGSVRGRLGRWAAHRGRQAREAQTGCRGVQTGGGEGKPLFLQVTLNWAGSEEEALQGADEQWRYNALGGGVSWELRSPEDFDVATRFVRPEDLRESVLISSDPGRHADWLNQYLDLGFQELLLHQVGRNQRAFVETFGTRVLPQLRSR